MAYPKQHIEKMKLRNQSYGKQRRLNALTTILEDSSYLPKSVELEDIDACVINWVENQLKIDYNGENLPTFRLFSNQRINEYSQTWNHLDEVGNLLMNFKTVTRENNPKKGESQGSVFNIPGDRNYSMFAVPVLQENGTEAYDIYTMKQPFALDLIYTISIITNKYELLNKMNQLVNDKFKALQCYIFPNNHPMPLTLEDITDESEYSLDDRKFYLQSFKIKLKAYIIQQTDFSVYKVPSRVTIDIMSNKNKKIKEQVVIDESYDECYNEEKRYYNKILQLNISFPTCENMVDFTIDTDIEIDTIETHNINDFNIFINGEEQDYEDVFKVYSEDIIHIEVEHSDLFKESMLTIKGIDLNTIIDKHSNNFDTVDNEIINI